MKSQQKRERQSNCNPEWKAKVDYNFYWIDGNYSVRLIEKNRYKAMANSKSKMFSTLEDAVDWCEKVYKNE